MPSVTMTYAELAARLGRTEPAAKSLAKRKRWRRSIGNDGLARITVDEDELAGMADPDRRGIGRPPANSVRTSVTEPGSNPDCGEIELGSNPVHKLQARLAVVEALAGERLASLDRERERADRLAAEVTDLVRQLARAAEDATAREREHQGQLVEDE